MNQLRGQLNAGNDARILLSEILRVPHLNLLLEKSMQVPPEAAELYKTAIKRRRMGEPVQYITGRAYFMGHMFMVGSGVLIPRQDTETLCEEAIRICEGMNRPDVLDLCTGSGAVAISISLACENANVTASDISHTAINYAFRNALALEAKIKLVQGDLFDPVSDKKFDIITCNPPYIRRGELNTLQREVRYEPLLALNGGDDGLVFIKRIAFQAQAYLKPGGWLLMEIGYDQSETASEWLMRIYGNVEIKTDLNGINRVMIAQKKE